LISILLAPESNEIRKLTADAPIAFLWNEPSAPTGKFAFRQQRRLSLCPTVTAGVDQIKVRPALAEHLFQGLVTPKLRGELTNLRHSIAIERTLLGLSFHAGWQLSESLAHMVHCQRADARSPPSIPTVV
jgi:hypothetical protein